VSAAFSRPSIGIIPDILEKHEDGDRNEGDLPPHRS